MSRILVLSGACGSGKSTVFDRFQVERYSSARDYAIINLDDYWAPIDADSLKRQVIRASDTKNFDAWNKRKMDLTIGAFNTIASLHRRLGFPPKYVVCSHTANFMHELRNDDWLEAAQMENVVLSASPETRGRRIHDRKVQKNDTPIRPVEFYISEARSHTFWAYEANAKWCSQHNVKQFVIDGELPAEEVFSAFTTYVDDWSNRK